MFSPESVCTKKLAPFLLHFRPMVFPGDLITFRLTPLCGTWPYIYIYIYRFHLSMYIRMIYGEGPITRILLIKSIWYFHNENPSLTGPSPESNCRQLSHIKGNCIHHEKQKRVFWIDQKTSEKPWRSQGNRRILQTTNVTETHARARRKHMLEHWNFCPTVRAGPSMW